MSSEEATLYFAYGSNLWLDQMARRCPGNTLLCLGMPFSSSAEPDLDSQDMKSFHQPQSTKMNYDELYKQYAGLQYKYRRLERENRVNSTQIETLKYANMSSRVILKTFCQFRMMYLSATGLRYFSHPVIIKLPEPSIELAQQSNKTTKNSKATARKGKDTAKTPGSKGPKMRPGPANTPRNICAREWINSNPSGTSTEFSEHFAKLTPEELDVNRCFFNLDS